MRYLVVPEAEHRSKCARAVLAPAEAATYQQACVGIVEPYKNVVRFDGAPQRRGLHVTGQHPCARARWGDSWWQLRRCAQHLHCPHTPAAL